MRLFGSGFIILAMLSACSTTSTPPVVVEPYVSTPLADLDADTEMHVLGNHLGWGTRFNGEWNKNVNGPKLQRLDTTGNANEYVAVFRNNTTLEYFGKATFLMPADGVTVSGTTSEGYEFEITRSNDNLIYTLTGQYTIAITAGTSPSKFAGGGFATGSSPAVGDMPTTGIASYSGDFIGFSTVGGDVTGDFNMSADFGSGSVNGTIDNLLTENGDLINDLTLQASISSGGDGYSGVVDVGITTGDASGFAFGTRGAVEGGFFGPNAEETGGAIRITDSQNILTGSYGGTQP